MIISTHASSGSIQNQTNIVNTSLKHRKGVSTMSPSLNRHSVSTNVNTTSSSAHSRPKATQIQASLASIPSSNNYLPKIDVPSTTTATNANSSPTKSHHYEQQKSSRSSSSSRFSFTPSKKNDREAPTTASPKSRKSFSTGPKSRTETISSSTAVVAPTKIESGGKTNQATVMTDRQQHDHAVSSSLPHLNHQQLFEKNQAVSSAAAKRRRRSLSSLPSSNSSIRNNKQQQPYQELDGITTLLNSSENYQSMINNLFRASTNSNSNQDLTVHKELLVNPFSKDLSSCKYLPEIPRPKVPDLTENQSMFTKFIKIQNFINSFEYNYIEQHFFDITRLRPLKSILSTAKEIIHDCLPIRCVEGTFLAIFFTQELEEVERFSVFFETEMAVTRTVYRHIVLVVRFKNKYGALGLSRKDDLYYKPLSYCNLSEILREYILSYSKYGHLVNTIYLSLPISHDSQSKDVPVWSFLKLDFRKHSLDRLMEKADKYMSEVTQGNCHTMYEKKKRKRNHSLNQSTTIGSTLEFSQDCSQ
ncbi:hypothetical protein C9374_006540 [Naegleria lovaniensis]|uniref:Uncharacterized protein n=1 Tax=Naegleria lovaniensis TaxID=51637 RepID=A0AA88KIZ6_NAELO|nr:uncharacterized protein C9374_006540 [Naegleria lovaniensis]KAG2379423.1 hypothetical protein C9374_006540 [Naegleria lovaniensis]